MKAQTLLWFFCPDEGRGSRQRFLERFLELLDTRVTSMPNCTWSTLKPEQCLKVDRLYRCYENFSSKHLSFSPRPQAPKGSPVPSCRFDEIVFPPPAPKRAADPPPELQPALCRLHCCRHEINNKVAAAAVTTAWYCSSLSPG